MCILLYDGSLPVKKYSSGSALNMFDEFTFLKDRTFGYVSEIIENSRKMLKSTVNDDIEAVIELL